MSVAQPLVVLGHATEGPCDKWKMTTLKWLFHVSRQQITWEHTLDDSVFCRTFWYTSWKMEVFYNSVMLYDMEMYCWNSYTDRTYITLTDRHGGRGGGDFETVIYKCEVTFTYSPMWAYIYKCGSTFINVKQHIQMWGYIYICEPIILCECTYIIVGPIYKCEPTFINVRLHL